MEVVVSGSGIQIGEIKSKKALYEVLLGDKSILSKVRVPNCLYEKQIVGSIVKEDSSKLEGAFKELPKASRILTYCIDEALQESKITKDYIRQKKVGIIVGTTGSFPEIEEHSYDVLSDSLEIMDTHAVGRIYSHAPATTLAKELGGVNGVVLTVNSGCTSGIEALSLAKTLIESKQLDICFVGAVDTPITNTIVRVFEEIKMISATADVHSVSKPFDKDSKGMAISEGAGLLILESKDSANDRGVFPVASIQKIISNNDNKGSNGADIRGNQMLKAVKDVLVGEVAPDYVNSQALGIRLNDRIEARVAKAIFPEEVSYSSAKGHLGHSFGASGVMQVITSILSLENDVIFPTINVGENVEKHFHLNKKPLKREVDSILITTHGYGGNNAVCLMRKVAAGSA